MVSIAEDVLDLAPKALFFNYGNPMAANCRAMVKATGAPVVGLCHGVFGVGYYLAKALGVARSDIHYSAVGINHLTWFVEVRARGEDAMPRLHEIAAEKVAARQSSSTEGADSGAGAPHQDHPFCWHLMHQLGAFPSAGDAHVTEFFPQFFREGRYYGKTLGVDAFNFENRIAGGDRIYAEMREDALSPQPLRSDYFDRFSGEHEQVLDTDGLVERVRSVSFVAVLPPSEQEDLLARVRELAGPGPMRLPYVTKAYVTTLL